MCQRKCLSIKNTINFLNENIVKKKNNLSHLVSPNQENYQMIFLSMFATGQRG